MKNSESVIYNKNNKCCDCNEMKITTKCTVCNRNVCKMCADINDEKFRPKKGEIYKLGNKDMIMNLDYKIMCDFCASEYYRLF